MYGVNYFSILLSLGYYVMYVVIYICEEVVEALLTQIAISISIHASILPIGWYLIASHFQNLYESFISKLLF